jgi:multidrug efflux pump subunit AcrA (membrane-fusion protein)
VDIVRVRMGQAATLTFDALAGKQYRGEVINVSRVGKTEQGKIQFEVEVRLVNGDDSVQPGMTAAVNVIVDERKDVLLIPNRAQRRRDGQQVVYLLREGQLVTVPVTLGLSDEENSELVSGQIQPGDSIVLDPPASATQPAAN